jgi:hypothetical protein
MAQGPKKIELAKLASDSASDVPSMVQELEGKDHDEASSNLHWPTRFISSGKFAPRRWPTR